MVRVSLFLKRIGLLDLCIPFDSQTEQLAAAHRRKLCTYGPLLEALLAYDEIGPGWQVKILPWVVGVRCMLDEKSVPEVMSFLQVPQDRRARISEDVMIKSVKALYSLHQIRYQAFRLKMHKAGTGTSKRTTGGGMAAASRHGAFDTDDPGTICNGKRRRRADEDYGETRRRWKKTASEAERLS
jgi:hypothetical protein